MHFVKFCRALAGACILGFFGATIASAAPTTPNVSGINPGSPTFEQSFTVSGTAQPGVRVYVGSADSRVLFNNLADANGNWSVPVSRQPVGSYNWVAWAQDSSGNSPTTSFAFTVQYDPPTPGSPAITSVVGPGAGTYTDYEWDTNHGLMGFSVRFSENIIVSGPITLVVRVGSKDAEFPLVEVSGNQLSFRRVPPSGLEGTLTISGPIKLNGGSIKGYDGDDASLAFTPVDLPSVYIDTKHPAPPVVSGFTPTSPTSEQSVTITGTAELGTTIWVESRQEPNLASTKTDANGNWSITIPPHPPGSYNFLAGAVDPAGNYSYDRAPGIPVSGVSIVVTVVSPSPVGRPQITTQPASRMAAMGSNATFTTATTATAATYQWQYNGTSIAGATNATLTVDNVTPDRAGLYGAVVTDGGNFTLSTPAILGLSSSVKVLGPGQEIGANIVHPNGNVYDQVLPQGAAITLRADPGQVARASWIGLSDEIIQAEFSGAGTLTIVLEVPSGPAAAKNYNQPDVAYMRGHAGLIITGADDTTNVAVFSVGRLTAVNQSIFRSDITYEGIANLAFIAILSSNGSFGGVRAGNANFWSTHGYTGIYAPGVYFFGPIRVCEITATEDAIPVLQLGAAADTQITGGDFLQTNGRAVQVSGLTKLRFVAGTTSDGQTLPAQPCRGRLENNGQDVTAQIVAQ